MPGMQLPDLQIEFVFQVLSEVYDWGLKDLNVPEIHKETLGEGVKVCVVDSGCSEHFEVENNVVASKNFTNSSTTKDKYGHACLHPDDFVHTTLGIQTIKEMYDSFTQQELALSPDESWSKYIEPLNIQTISLNPETQECDCDTIIWCHKIRVKDEILNVQLRSGNRIRLTPDHVVYYKETGKRIGRKPACELEIGDGLIVNRNGYLPFDDYQTIYYNHRQCVECGYRQKFKISGPMNQCKQCLKYNTYQEQIQETPFNEMLAWIVGVWIADGHVHIGKSAFSILYNNNKHVLNNASQFLSKLGFKSILRKNSLVCYSKPFCELLEACGVPSGNQTTSVGLPAVVTKSPKTVFYSFLAGVVDGDGCISKKESRCRIASESKGFANELALLLRFNGIKSSITTIGASNRQCPTKGYVFKNDTFYVAFTPPEEMKKYLAHDVKKSRVKTEKFRQRSDSITRIDKEVFDGYFYDFTTKKYHNYLGNGIVISNTFISGIVAAEKNDEGVIGVAPKAQLYFAKAMDDGGRGNPASLVHSVKWAVDQGVDIISISAGSFFDFKPLHKVIQHAYRKNIIVVAAAGNSGKRHYDVAFPARYPEVIGVAAYNKAHEAARFSSRGINVFCAMPGVDIYSTWLDNGFCKSKGTCLTGNSMVYTTNGPVPIKDISAGQRVYSFDINNHEVITNRVQKQWSRGKDECKLIQTKHRKIEATGNHPFLVYSNNDFQWKQAETLKRGDLLVCPKYLKEEGSDIQIKPKEYWNVSLTELPKINSDLMYLLGFYLGDGWITKLSKNASSVYFAKCNIDEINQKLLKMFKSVFLYELQETNNSQYICGNTVIAEIFEQLCGHDKVNLKKIPVWLFNSSKEHKESFIAGLVDSNGWLTKTGYGFSSYSLSLTEGLAILLDYLGYRRGPVHTRHRKIQDPNSKFPKMSSESTLYFCFEGNSTKYNEAVNKFENYSSIQAGTNVRCEKIVSISDIGTHEIFDIQVENNHNFIANNVIVHNSYACPMLSGVCALILAHHRSIENPKTPCETPRQMMEHLKKYSRKLSDLDKRAVGFGTIDLEQMFKEA